MSERHQEVVRLLTDEVLIGDPALGIKYLPRTEFETMWDNGVLFIIKNKPEIGKQHFNLDDEWQLLARAPLGNVLSTDSLAAFTVSLPRMGDF